MIGIATVVPQFSSQAGSAATGGPSVPAAAEATQAFSANLLAYGANLASGPSRGTASEPASVGTHTAKPPASMAQPTSPSAKIWSEAVSAPKQASNEKLASESSLIASAKSPAGQLAVPSNALQTSSLLSPASAQRTSAAGPGVVVGPTLVAKPPVAGSHPVQPGTEPAERPGASSSNQPQDLMSPPDAVPQAIPAPATYTRLIGQSTSATASASVAEKGDTSSPPTDSVPTRKQLKTSAVNAVATPPTAHPLLPPMTALVVPLVQPMTLHQPATSGMPASSTKAGSQSATAKVALPPVAAGQTFAVSAPQIQSASVNWHLNPNVDASDTTTAHPSDTHSAPSLTEHSFASVVSSSLPNTATSEASSSPQSATPANGWNACNVPVAVSGLHLGDLAPAIGLPMQPQRLLATHTAAPVQPAGGPAQGSAAATAAGHSASEPYLATQTTLRATPNSLEVGLSGGTQGWLKVRAEVHGDNVSATLSSTSTTGTKLLHEQLPALNAFLSTQNISVATTVAQRLAVNNEQHSAMANLSHEGSQQGNSSQSQPQRQFNDVPESGATSSMLGPLDSHVGAVSLLQPTLLAGSGSWLNVLA